MSDTIVLRKVFAVDSNTGLFIPSGSTLLTNGLGGTQWTPLIPTIGSVLNPVIGDLTIKINSLSNTINTDISNINTSIINLTNTVITDISNVTTNLTNYIDNSIATDVSGLQTEINYLQGQINGLTPTNITDGLGSLGYISSLSLFSTVYGLGTAGYISTATLTAAIDGIITTNFVSTPSLNSTVYGLGQIYISSLTQTPANANAIVDMGFVSTSELFSSVYGLGQIYLSSSGLHSTVYGLGTAGYISSPSLRSTVYGLGTAGYVSSASLISTVHGLSTFGYVNRLQLFSTTSSLMNLKNNIRFDNVTTAIITGGINNFSGIQNLIYRSTFTQSTISYSGAPSGVQITTNLTNPSQGTNLNLLDMEFSTLSMKLDAFSSFIIEGTSRITLDIYPTLAFSKLATGASNTAILPISTMLKYGNNTFLNETTTTSYLYAVNTRTLTENSVGYVDASNIFNQPIRLIIPNTTKINYDYPYSVYHYMPSSMNNGELQNALHINRVTPYFGGGSVFLTVQNSL